MESGQRVFVGSGCAVLEGLQQSTLPGAGGWKQPEITFQEAVLVQAPSREMMAAYYCPRVVPDPFGVPGAAAAVCARALGRVPTQVKMPSPAAAIWSSLAQGLRVQSP